MARLLSATVVLATLLCAAPAIAQFGSIFSDPPPRPPGNVPQRGAAPPRSNFPAGRDAPPQQQPVQDPDDADDDEADVAPPVQQRRPQAQQQAPAMRRGIEDIQSQPLPPPPGAPAAPLGPGTPNAPPATPSPQQATPAPGVPQQPTVQRLPRGAPPQPGDTAPQPGDEVVVQPPEQKIANPTAVFSGLDKITGRTISFDVAINETVQFGALQVTPRVCYARPPTETPNTDAFVSVDEVTLQGEVRRIFTGWMFASSPGLHAVEHPIYDVWLTECKGAMPSVAEGPPPEAAAAKPAPKPAPARAPRNPSRPPPNSPTPFR